jgi:hypothetical protein
MTIYSFNKIEDGYLEDLPGIVGFHYQYQTKPKDLSKVKDPSGFNFPFLSVDPKVVSGEKHIYNMYNFPPKGMKRIRSKDLFNHSFNAMKDVSYVAHVQLTYNEFGERQPYQSGQLFFCGDNFGYAILNGYGKDGWYTNFYIFGCTRHKFDSLTLEECEKHHISDRPKHMYAVLRCNKCGFWMPSDSSD